MSIWTTVPAHVVPQPNIPVLSVGNLKGGVGKTTVVANLAMALVQANLRVLAIDLDFQASLSVALPPSVMLRNEQSDGGINVLHGGSYDMFHDDRVTERGVGRFSQLRLVRTSLDLAEVEDKLFARFILGKDTNDHRFELASKLSDPRLREDFDLVLIDTPPRLTMASINALCASTHVLIPTSLTPMSLSGAVTFTKYLDKFRNALCPNLKVLSVLPTMTRGTLNAAEITTIENLRRALPGVDVWDDCFIPSRQAIADNVHTNVESRQIFLRLASNVIRALRLSPDGEPDRGRAHRSSQFRWTRTSQ